MSSYFDGKVIAITGAASGMGLETAKLLASRGAIISLADLNESSLSAAVKLLPGQKHMTTVVDVRKSALVNKWIENTVRQLGRLDGAVNMAGVFTINAPIRDETDEGWDFVMDVNAKGVFYSIRAELRHMKAGGSIVSAASVDGQIGFANIGAYCASKHAVIGLTRSAAKENPEIRLNCVAPGVINTPMMNGEDHAKQLQDEVSCQIQKRAAEPVEVARVIAFLLSDEASFVTGAVYNVDGGWVC